MRIDSISNQMLLVSVVNNRKIDYYLVLGGREEYAFTKRYSSGCHRLCCSGIRVKDLLTKKSCNKAIMNLVSTSNRMVPYLIEYLELYAA